MYVSKICVKITNVAYNAIKYLYSGEIIKTQAPMSINVQKKYTAQIELTLAFYSVFDIRIYSKNAY